MPPDRKRGGPLGTTPGNRTEDPVATTATDNTALIVVRRDEDATANLSHLSQIRVTAAPVAFASAYAPSGRRHLWAFAYICPRCGFGHLGRADSEQEINGRRHRGSCGRTVAIRTARVYRGQQTQTVAG